jgi:hypothetical protein
MDQATVVGFERPQRKQVYLIFDFKDTDGSLHRVVNRTRQARMRFTKCDAGSIAYSRSTDGRMHSHTHVCIGCTDAAPVDFDLNARKRMRHL